MSAANQPFNIVRRLLFMALLLVGVVITCNYRQASHVKDLETKIAEKLESHREWTKARYDELEVLEKDAETLEVVERDRRMLNVAGARDVLDEAVAADRAEILELWNEARNLRSKMPTPEFEE
jgi:hypothetical protein